ncbi:MAG: cytochrome c oxidase accessory protein CcoG [Candidatus Sericytochromatia bacterium]|nr:cytochrome c oxidase accessory protein CcoG [Candidatus Tanganyikabacteria bacterium]
MIIKEALDLTSPRQRIFVKAVRGRFQRLRWMGFSILLLVFLATPFLRWGDRPAVLFDLAARRFHVFGFTVWPHEMFLLAGVLLAAALALSFFTTLAGRLWCGYACPQTVYVSLFLEIERLIEGDRPRQQRLARGGWTPRRLATGAVKHALFLAVAGFVGFVSVAYFIPYQALWADVVGWRLGAGPAFWFALTAGWLYLDGAFFREQICIYPCPYGRFQGALTDSRSLTVGYDAARGEPRGPARAGEGGDCVDCTLCVQSCPMGIDIRDGLQGECINCARCVDACDFVMSRVGRPPGLIRYDSAAAFEHRPAGGRFRPKLVAYGALLAIVGAAVGAYMATRADTRLEVTRAPGLYKLLPDGSVADLYTVRALNFTDRPRTFRVEVADLPGASLRGQSRIAAGPEAMVPVSLAVVAPAEAAVGSRPIRFWLVEGDRRVASREANFIGPEARGAERIDR